MKTDNAAEDQKVGTMQEFSDTVTDQAPVEPQPLRSLYLYIAGGCNLACRHCWITPRFDPDAIDDRYISLPLVEKAVNQAKPLGLKSAKLTGGEPMLHPRFFEIVSFLSGEDLEMVMETNGTLIDARGARSLRNLHKMRFISVSIDGADAAVHDSLRGVSGSFERAIEGIRHLVEVGYRPQLICTLHNGNVGQADDVVSMAAGLGCGSVKFNHLQDMGRGTRIVEREAIPDVDLPELYRTIERRYRRGPLPVCFDIPMAFRTHYELLHTGSGLCNILNILGVLSGGELAMCGVGVDVPELVYGNLKTDDLEAVWREAPGLQALRTVLPETLEGICGVCMHRDRCMGGCIAQNFFDSGRLSAPHRFCSVADESGYFPQGRKRKE